MGDLTVKARILLATKEAQEDAALRQSLDRPNDFRVTECSLGRPALDLVRSGTNRFDIVIATECSSDDSWLELLKSVAGRPFLPFILLVDAGREPVAARALALGACECVIRDKDGGYLELLPSIVSKVFAQREMLATLEQLESDRRLHLDGLASVVRFSADVVAQTTVQGVLDRLVEAARKITGARMGIAGHGFAQGEFYVGSVSKSSDLPPCPERGLFDKERGGVYLEVVGRNQALRLTDKELREHVSWRGIPEDHLPLSGLLAVPLSHRHGVADGLIMVSDKAGRDFTAEDESLLIQLASVAALRLEHIHIRIRAEQRAEEAEEAKRILEALMEHVPEGIAIADADDRRIRMISKFGNAMISNGDGVDSTVEASETLWNLAPAEARNRRELKTQPLERAIGNGEVIVGEERVLNRSDGTGVIVLCNSGPIRNQEGRITGGIIAWRDITSRKRDEELLREGYEDMEVRVRERTAELASLNEQLRNEIIEHMDTEDSLERSRQALRLLSSKILAVQEEANKKIAEKLHDSTCQSLASIKILAENSMSQIEEGSPALEILQVVVDSVRSSIEELDGIITELRPAVLDDLGVLAAVSWCCREFRMRHPAVEVRRVTTINENEIPEQLKLVIFRIVQEALNNIGIHSNATSVLVALRKETDALELEIRDDGTGFDPSNIDSEEAARPGIGLASMRERSKDSGGDLRIESGPGEGTRIKVRWSTAPEE